MNAAVIKVRFANPPREGKKKASIKTDDDQIFGVWPRQLGLFQPGRSYKIEFEESTWKGQTYRTITKCEPAADVEERTNEAGTSSQRGSQTNSVEAQFVARVLSASIMLGAVKLERDSLTSATKLIRTVYRDTFVAG
jgi:hypothetical protein